MNDAVREVVFNPGASRVAVVRVHAVFTRAGNGKADEIQNFIDVWDLAARKRLATVAIPNTIPRKTVLSPDGSHVLCATRTDPSEGVPRTVDLRLYDVTGGRLVRSYSGYGESSSPPVFTKDGRRIAAPIGNNAIAVWAVDASEPRYIIPGNDRAVGVCDFSPDGSRLVSVTSDNVVTVRLAATGATVLVLRAPAGFGARHEVALRGTGSFGMITTVGFTADGRGIVSAAIEAPSPDAKGGRLVVRRWDATPLAGR